MSIWTGFAGSALGAAASGLGSFFQNREAARSVDKQIAFQRESRQNAYQWAMADMRKAGLNPILAYKQGGAAPAAGASYQPSNVLGEAVNSARANAQAAAQLKQLRASADNLQQDTAKKLEETHKTAVEGANALKRGRILDAAATSAKAQAQADIHKEAFFKTDFGKLMRDIDLTGRSLNPFASSASSAASAARGKR
ncbi:putative minor capsid protein [Eel River basin pequenovirus]|nr:putative minor capsid protein [Eel River basin pequenovirus]